MKYYISDLHFGHKNIITYDNRPFFTVKEMDSELIENWNSVVTNEDEVYILGDISWLDKEITINIINQLNGKKYLIRGNHDSFFNSNFPSNGFQWIKDYAEIKDGSKTVILSHYPMPVYKNIHHGNYHLFGHVHDTADSFAIEKYLSEIFERYKLPRRAFNVGCMKPWMDYTPRTLEQIENGYNKYMEVIKKFNKE